MLLLGSLSGGGAERVAVNLVNRCDPALVDLRLGLLRRSGPFLAEVDPGRVDAPSDRAASPWDVIQAPLDIARMVRAGRPQVVMSFGMGVNMLTWLALRGLGRDRPGWICREDSNTDVEIDNLLTNPAGRAVVRWARARVYRSADCLLAVAHDLASMLERRTGPGRGRTRVIRNPIDVARIERAAAESLAWPPERPFIVAAGRLE